jgi:hypothetical protein
MSTNRALRDPEEALRVVRAANDTLILALARLRSAKLVLDLEASDRCAGAAADAAAEVAECAVLHAALRAEPKR